MGTELTYQVIDQQRQILGEILPNDMPLGITIHVTNLCNFKCFYCSASQPAEKRKADGLLLQHMSCRDFKACIDSIAKAGHVKVLNLCGWGEPLFHPDIAEMAKYAKNANVADCIKIISNGSLLTHEMSDALIDAGISNIRISLQGLDAKAYEETSGIKINFDQFLENIKYFYEHRKDSTISLRIMDHMIAGHEDEFQQKFAHICNDYTVGSLIKTLGDIDFTNKGSELNKTFSGGFLFKTDVCSMPFFRGYIDVDCRLMSCCMLPQPCKFGDVRESFYNVWNGKEHLRFLLTMLTDKNKYKVCANCDIYRTLIEKADQLDPYRDDLIAKYTALLKSAEAGAEGQYGQQ